MGFLFLHAVPKRIHQGTKAALKNVYFSASHDTDPQKMEIYFLVDWSAVMQLLISPNQATSASFSRNRFESLKSGIWEFELCLVFPSLL